MSLNEQLAELCGIKLIGDQWGICEGESEQWTPTTDLNQLRMCYEVLSEDEKTLFSHMMLTEYVPKVFTAPEYIAQAILKAKGVS